MTARPLELALEASFEQLSATVPANVGVAIARPGQDVLAGRLVVGRGVVDDQGAPRDSGAA